MDFSTSSFLNLETDDGAASEIFSENCVPAGDEPLWVKCVLEKRRSLAKPLYEWLRGRTDLYGALCTEPSLSGELFIFLCRMMKNSPEFFNAAAANKGLRTDIFSAFAQSAEEEILEKLADADILVDEPSLAVILLKNPFISDKTASRVTGITGWQPDFEEKKELEENLYGQIQKMSIAQKIKLASKGNKQARGLLVRSPNKQISGAVMRNPRMTEEEVEFLMKSKSTSEHIFREVALNKEWMKSYNIISAMAVNPKTPLDITMGLVGRLMSQDVERIAKSKEVPATLRQAAARIVEQKAKKP
ncbi:hypothetical protein EP073_05565 [Geovibrio thiophilus]|uniref:Uncharacterized protein n=1 Tax=Geovibrio thiophilus TaxID=139438 RepID=A0A410JXJ3_9BACT|nr:hypothetical protein [Geovibrio thiophilus]QAR32890.1 hypothetical protein EP073_05565 [Geovibrio thiophilus]